MTATARLTVAQALRRAAARAILAPSIHNSQPWRFILTKGVLELHADRARQLQVLDPASRQLMISCGCALFNVRVALAAAGYATDVQRFPEPGRSGLLARLSAIDPEQGPVEELAALDPAIELRHTNRRRFTDERMPAELVEDLVAAAAAEGANLLPIRGNGQLRAVTALSQRAAAQAEADPAYRAEMRAWTTDPTDLADTVPAVAVPHSGHGIPVRALGLRGPGGAPTAINSQECLLLLWTAGDNPFDWLHAGEALQRALLELTRWGYAAGIMSQVAELPAVRAALRRELDLTGAPHLLLRVGRAPVTPATRRRRLVEVLVEHL
jgi:nitroreductase